MRYHDCGPRLTSCTGACNFDVQMAQKMRLSDPNRVAARDSKLWTREESRATRRNVRQVHCPCTGRDLYASVERRAEIWRAESVDETKIVNLAD
jgi:hypothetical protein